MLRFPIPLRRGFGFLLLAASLLIVPARVAGAEVSVRGDADTAGSVQPDRFWVVLAGAFRDLRGTIRGGPGATPRALEFVPASNCAIAPIGAAELAGDGSLVFKPTSVSFSDGTDTGGIYLLPGFAAEQIGRRSREWLRATALAAREFPRGAVPPEITVDRFVPMRCELDARGRVSNFGVYGENLAATAKPESLVWCGERPAIWAGTHDAADAAETVISFRDPQGSNPIEVKIARRGDRIAVFMSYEVKKAVDASVPVHFQLPLAQPLVGLYGVSAQLTHSKIRGTHGTGAQQFKPQPGAQSLYCYMAQSSLCVASARDGSYVSVLDYALSNLIVEARRAEGGGDTLQVSTYLWPRELGRTYHWTFEIMAGRENIYNAALRATWPYTQNNHEIFSGAVGREIYNDFPNLDEPFDKGIRAIWYHQWFRRNGDYFNPDWPADQPYQTAFTEFQSYSGVGRAVQRFQSRGFMVFMYCQMAGISADLMDRFGDSVVRDPQGEPVRAGQDGQIYNLWANPDPAGNYGRSILQQIAGLLPALHADGIALDRGDRLDWTYGLDEFDYGHFNGYSSVFGQRRPVSSLTIAGRDWLVALRHVLDAQGKKLFVNLASHLYVIDLADAVLMEIPDNPDSWVWEKIFTNGKSAAYTAKGRINDGANNILAELSQVYPYHRFRLETGLHVPGLPPSEHFVAGRPRGRLLYIGTESGGEPAWWFFDNGYTHLKYDPAFKNVEFRFRGSEFVRR